MEFMTEQIGRKFDETNPKQLEELMKKVNYGIAHAEAGNPKGRSRFTSLGSVSGAAMINSRRRNFSDTA